MSEPHEVIDLTIPASIHVVGVGGAGMSALAIVLAQMGHTVSGSDIHESQVFDQLRRAGVDVKTGHRETNRGGAYWVTSSPAVRENNVELTSARENGCRLMSRAEMLGALTRVAKTMAVAGTHGKTTTTSMLSLILVHAQRRPSFLIGAPLSGMGINAVWNEGSLLVLEADESYGSFGELEPWMSGVTNIEADHLDYYQTLSELEAAFERLCERTTGPVLYNADDKGAARVGRARHGIGVGIEKGNDVLIHGVSLERAASSFKLGLPSGTTLSLRIAAPGRHNVQNAALAAAMASVAGVDDEAVVEGLAHFTGVPRRFEFRGTASGITFVDDYAHLPSEVAATVAAGLAGGFTRVICVFQPHRYTRTQAVSQGFAYSFDGAHHVVVTPIYGSGEEPIPGVSGRLVAQAITPQMSPGTVHFVEDPSLVVDEVLALLEPGDLCLTMGAGDLTELPERLIERLR